MAEARDSTRCWWSETRITVLVRLYTALLAKVCPWPDAILVDPRARATSAGRRPLLAQLRGRDFDAFLS